MRGKQCFLVILLISTAFLFMQLPGARAQDEPQYYRGPNYETYSYPNGTVFWSSQDQAVYNGSQWVPYVFQNNYAEAGYFQVQAGLIGLRLYKGKIEYYDPTFQRLAVGRENWAIFKKNGDEWIPICGSLASYFDTATYQLQENSVDVKGSWSTAGGSLDITLHIENDLKHTVEFQAANPGLYAVAQIWNNTQYEKVNLENATVIHKTDDVVVGKADSLRVLFHNSSEPFGILEDQRAAEDKYQYCLFAGGSMKYQGFQISNAVAWIFGVWDLATGETLTIDPTTATLNDPITDGTARLLYDGVNNYDKLGLINIIGGYSRGPSVYMVYRAYVEWDISSLDLPGIGITDVKFRYHASLNENDCHIHEMRIWRPSTETAQSVYIEAGEGTVYVSLDGFPEVGTEKVVDLGSNAETDVESQISNGWFAIGIQADTELTGYQDPGDEAHSHIYSEAYSSANPKPTLEITYSFLNIADFQASASTVYDDEWFNLNCSLNDGDGISYIKNCTVALNGSVVLAWDNTTATFSINQDPNSFCTLNSSACIEEEKNSTAFTLSWRIKLTSSYPTGSIDVLSSSTVYDSTGASSSGSESGVFTFALRNPEYGGFTGTGGRKKTFL